MKLPNADHALIEPAKLYDYLLSSTHPIGRFKSSFFAALGYSKEQWPHLEADLLELAATGEAERGQITEYGQKYEIRGILRGPTDKVAEIVSVWIILTGEDIPRFVTAFPGGKG